MTFPTPTKAEIVDAFRDFGVNFVEHKKCNLGRNAWTSGLRAATMHTTVGKNSADYLASFTYGGCNAVVNNGKYNGIENDGRAVILAWGSAYHSGLGGPWKGVAGEDSLHLVSWGWEIESLSDRKDITDAQIENTGRGNAAFVQLGMPVDNIHRHEDWTDASGPVTGPLRHRPPNGRTTDGRKTDTPDQFGYTTTLWVAEAKKYAKKIMWDGHVPTYAAIKRAEEYGFRSPAAYRLACRLYDKGFGPVPQPKGIQGYPARRVEQANRIYGINDAGHRGRYTPALHLRIFPQ